MGDAVVIRNGVLLGERGLVEGCDLLIEGGRISAIGPALHCPGAIILDATDHLVAPGLVDLHIHGAAGALFEDADPDAVAAISGALPRYGTTSLLATIAALPPDRLRAAVEAIARGSRAAAGSRILGIHLEGPFLNPQRAGAQRADWMRAPSLDEIDALQRASGGLIRLVTLAPELPGALEVIGTLRARGIAVALGHSAADVDTVSRAVDAGATHVTHLFNAMGTLHQRAPGLIGAALTDDRLSVELICDGEHVHRQAVDVAVRCKPPGTIVLVSDAVAACSARRGDIELFGTVCVAGDAVRVKATGQLAGSCLTLDAALRRMRAWFPALPPVRCVGMATAAPAAVIGTTDAGILAPGRMADVVVLTQELEVAATLCGGRIAYRRG